MTKPVQEQFVEPVAAKRTGITLAVTAEEATWIVEQYCRLNEYGCYELDAGVSDFNWWVGRANFLAEAAGLDGRAIQQRIIEQVARESDADKRRSFGSRQAR